MNIPYRTRRVLNRLAAAGLVLLLLFVIAWLCWVLWLQRYVVYVDNGAKIDFSLSANEVTGITAEKPKAPQNISIFYNEGADAIDTSAELSQLSGYYIDSNMLQQDMQGVLLRLDKLPAGTAILVDMKGPFGSFFYPSQLSDAVHSASTDVEAVASLIERIQKKGFYTIARVSSLRDRQYGDTHVSSGLYMLSRAGLWMDEGGMYWLDPTNSSTTSWISSVVLELRDMGFNEVLLSNFYFPDTDQYIFTGDKVTALQTAASTILSACASATFTLSFGTNDPTFALPDGRTRLYLENVQAANVGATAAKATMTNPEARLVFLADTGDTRFNEYSVLRSIYISDVVEALNNG